MRAATPVRRPSASADEQLTGADTWPCPCTQACPPTTRRRSARTTLRRGRYPCSCRKEWRLETGTFQLQRCATSNSRLTFAATLTGVLVDTFNSMMGTSQTLDPTSAFRRMWKDQDMVDKGRGYFFRGGTQEILPMHASHPMVGSKTLDTKETSLASERSCHGRQVSIIASLRS